eukprot:scaffold333_cov230-Pinguiococcus_pyrenoidosus.AAC.1
MSYDCRGNVVESILRTEFLYADLAAFVERYKLDGDKRGLVEVGGKHTRTRSSLTVGKHVTDSGRDEIRECY